MLPHRITRKALIAVANFIVFSSPQFAHAEILPAKGVFQGFYHENLAGVGKFAFYHVAPELRKQFAAYEGKFIEVEVLDALQPINPGSAFIKAVGKIKELPQPPVTVEIKTRFPGAGGDKTFDIVYRFKNTGAHPLELDANLVCITLSRFQTWPDPDKKSAFGGGYTNQQLSFRGEKEQVFNFVYPPDPGDRSHFHTGHVQLLPGESASFVRHSLPNEGGKCEVEVNAPYSDAQQKWAKIEAWRALELPLTHRDLTPSGSLRVDAEIERNHEWLTVRGQIQNTTEQRRTISLKQNPSSGRPWHNGVLRRVEDSAENVFLPALVQLAGKEKALAAELDWRDQDGIWIQRQLNKNGVPFQFNIRPADVFSNGEQASIELWLLTDEGLEKFVLGKDLQTISLPPPADWGERVEGVRSRIRLAKNRFKTDEAIRFFWQAEVNESNRSRCLWLEKGDDLRITIDGKIAKPDFTYLLSPETLCRLPLQRDLELEEMKLTPGKHTLEVSLTGAGGTYQFRGSYQAANDPTVHSVPKFKGTLTARAEFVVE